MVLYAWLVLSTHSNPCCVSFYVISGIRFPPANLLLCIECIDSMDWSPSWEATHCSACQKFLHLLWNPMVHYRLHNSSTCSLSWTIKSILHFPIGLFLPRFAIRTSLHFLPPLLWRHAQLILVDLLMLMVLVRSNDHEVPH